MSVEKHLRTVDRLFGAIADGFDDFVVARGAGNGADANEVRRRCLCQLDDCFTAIEKAVDECHGLAARRRPVEAPAPARAYNGGLN